MLISKRLFWSFMVAPLVGALAESLFEWTFGGQKLNFDHTIPRLLRIWVVGAVVVFPLLIFLLRRKMLGRLTLFLLVVLLVLLAGLLNYILDGFGFVEGAIGGAAAGAIFLLILFWNFDGRARAE